MANLSDLKGIGPKTVTKLKKLEIAHLTDLIHFYPTRYLDFSHQTTVAQAQIQDQVSLSLQVSSFKNFYSKGRQIQIANCYDTSGQISLIWLNQPYLSKTIKPNIRLYVAGQISQYRNQKTIFFPVFSTKKLKNIIPIYPQTKGLTTNQISKIITTNLPQMLAQVTDYLSPSVLAKYQLLPLHQALTTIHQPQSLDHISSAQKRLATDELIEINLSSLLAKHLWQKLPANFHLHLTPSINQKINRLISHLPFTLTADQVKVWGEIKQDLIDTHPANRLIQGDVGCGKTIIALLACYLTHLNQHLSAIITPTEVLANQHYQLFKKYLPHIPCYLHTSSHQTKLTNIPLDSIIISTHSLFYAKDKVINQLGLLVIDEQHKFGVDQRQTLLSATSPPHTLTLTATPIPRSAQLALMGNLSFSSIKTLPANKKPAQTFVVPVHKQPDCYQWLATQLVKTKSQAFVVCPFVQDSDLFQQVASAQSVYQQLTTLFPQLKIGLIHSGLKTKNQTMELFSQGQLHILVSTPIIEVGVDISTADYIVINSAERFGLSQLHQLRGRVGRAGQPSFCFLFDSIHSPDSQKRLNFIKNTYDCFKIAKYDLQNRGPGTIFSYLQHGFPQLRLADLSQISQNKQAIQIAQYLFKHHPQIVNRLINSSSINFLNQN